MTIDGRQAAILQAKELSSSGGRVRVLRDDKRVDMVFQRGLLEQYQFETHGRSGR